MRRPSAGMRSPASTETMSPGTSCSAGSSISSPPRSTRALMIIISWSAATAAAALPSWAMPMAALSRVRPMSMMPVPYCSTGQMLKMPATSSTICMRSWYWRTKTFQPGSFSPSANLLGPYWSRRAVASAPESPVLASTPAWARASSGLSRKGARSLCAGVAVTWSCLLAGVVILPGCEQGEPSHGTCRQVGSGTHDE